jgi:hypothetical protein
MALALSATDLTKPLTGNDAVLIPAAHGLDPSACAGLLV